jgi:hypothetical protein
MIVLPAFLITLPAGADASERQNWVHLLAPLLRRLGGHYVSQATGVGCRAFRFVRGGR